ncbi:hypothetical protein EJB05_06177, partial [Eragrostis curvula]
MPLPLAAQGDHVVNAGKVRPRPDGGDKEINRVLCILSRKSKNSAVLVGAACVGKTAIADRPRRVARAIRRRAHDQGGGGVLFVVGVKIGDP